MRSLFRGLSALLAVIVLARGFPAGDRIMVVALAVAVAAFLVGLVAPGRGLTVIALACSITGAATAANGPRGILPWPALIALWFGAGAAIRHRIRRAPSSEASLDRAAAGLGVFWFASASVGVLSARGLWAASHGLSLRAVNVIGSLDVEAIHRALLALAAVFSGLTIYDVARRTSPAHRRRAVSAFVMGVALSAGVAWLQARGFVDAPRQYFWKILGRFQGLESDPNAAGVLAALALGPALAAALRGRARAIWVALALCLAAGIAVSGSRSGILAGGFSVVLVALLEFRSGARWPRAFLVLLVAGVAVVLWAASHGHGGAAERLVSIFRDESPIEYRTSSRGLFWSCAWDAFRAAPLGGIGWNAFSWQLPTLAAARGVTTPVTDNPGNFYLEILCETGVAGLLIFATFVVRGARSIGLAIRREPDRVGGAAALIAFAAALLIGSHLLAAEVSIAAFLLLADVAPEEREVRPRHAGRALIVVTAAAIGWALLLAPTASSREAFRYSTMMGLYPRERAGGSVFRWMRPRAAVEVAAGARERWTLVFPGSGPRADRLTVRSGGRLLLSRALTRDPVTIALIAGPRQPAIFLVQNSESFRPSDRGAPDSRLLSVQVIAPPR